MRRILKSIPRGARTQVQKLWGIYLTTMLTTSGASTRGDRDSETGTGRQGHRERRARVSAGAWCCHRPAARLATFQEREAEDKFTARVSEDWYCHKPAARLAALPSVKGREEGDWEVEEVVVEEVEEVVVVEEVVEEVGEVVVGEVVKEVEKVVEEVEEVVVVE
ncbi:uncharacterized protein LOC142907963 isoform X4 [Petromyzon marinus]